MTARTPASAAMAALLERRQIVLSDFPMREPDRGSQLAGAAALREHVDAALVGEPPSVTAQLPHAYRARLLTAEGLGVWSTVNGRDRNRVAIEGELAALAHAGAVAAHCVSGDPVSAGRRPEARPVFDLDSSGLVPLARAAGLLVSAAESVETPPVEQRPARFARKVAAGAELAFLNLVSGPDPVDRFLRALEALGAGVRALVCVPLVIDAGSARILTGLDGHAEPTGLVATVLGADDPREAGIRAAVGLAERILAVPGVAGVNVSGGATRGRELEYAEALAETARRIGLR